MTTQDQRARFLYAISGVTSVTTDAASFVVAPHRGVWIPAGVAHEVQCRGNVSVRAVYIDERARNDLSAVTRVVEVSRLLRVLLVEAMRIPVEHDVNGRDGRVMALLLDEIAAAARVPMQLPMPSDRRLLRICRAILEDPARANTLDDCALIAGMCRRNFTRVFRRETSMTFSAWRQRVRLMLALTCLSGGKPVTTVAFDVGYRSPSAFTAMFRKAFGVAPTSYVAPKS